MKTVDKGGIHIEQCDGCRGIFLDFGELEQIVNAEHAYYGQSAGAPPPYRPAGPAPAAPHHGYADSPRPYHGGYRDSPRPYGGHGHGHRRRRSFLEDLFD